MAYLSWRVRIQEISQPTISGSPHGDKLPAQADRRRQPCAMHALALLEPDPAHRV